MNAALLTALSIKPKYNTVKQIFLITDGEPTVGVTDIFTILENIKRLNVSDFQIHALAIQSGVDAKLLQGLTRLTNGHSKYVHRLSDLSNEMVQFVKSFKTPGLGSVRFSVSNAELKDVFGNNYMNIYQDAKSIIVGRYKKPGRFKLYLSGKGQAGEKKLQFDINLEQSTKKNTFIKHIWQNRKLGFSLENDENFLESDYADIGTELSVVLDDYDISDDKDTKSTREKAISKIETLKRLKEAVLFNEIFNPKTKIIDNKSFELTKDGYWEDSSYSSLTEDSAHVLHLKYGGKSYIDLAKKDLGLRPFLALSNRLKLNYSNFFFKIDEYGHEEINHLPF